MRTINTILAIQTSSTANLLVHYIRKLPLLNKLISAQFYANNRMKTVMAIIARILITLGKFVTSFAYVGLVIYWPIMMSGESLTQHEQWGYFVHLFFVISFIAAGISSAIILEPKRSKYITVKLMRMSPTRYMKATLSYKYITFFICLTPAVLYFGTSLGGSITQLLLLTASATMWRIVCEYLHLKYFEKTGNALIKQTGIVWLCLGLCYAAAFAGFLPIELQWTPYIHVVLFNYYLAFIMIALGVFIAMRLYRYSDYRNVVDAATKRDDPLLNIGQLMADANKANVQTKADDYVVDQSSQDRLNSKEGYAYLNALFFARHRSIVRRPLSMRIYVVIAIGVVGTIASLFMPSFAEFYVANLAMFISALALAMLYLSVGERTCKAMFFNCDLSMLKYSFYRSAAIQHFKIRLNILFKQNLLIGIALAFCLTLTYYFSGGELMNIELVLLWISSLVLTLFFSVHHLFLYYFLQPYTTELNLKNPFFFLVTFIISAACGVAVFIQAPALSFAIVVFIFTMLYTVAALVLVQKYGSRTFRVK